MVENLQFPKAFLVTEDNPAMVADILDQGFIVHCTKQVFMGVLMVGELGCELETSLELPYFLEPLRYECG